MRYKNKNRHQFYLITYRVKDLYESRITKTARGLRIITQSMPHSRSVSVVVGIGVGSRHEPNKYAGISHFLEHMLFKGTENRPNHKFISEPIESTGGSLNASTGYDSTFIWCRVPREFITQSLDLIFDMINNSVFRKADIVKERQVIIEELRSLMDDPESLADTKLDELMWDGTPLGRDIAGNQYSVSMITKENLKKHLKHNYVPSNTVVSISGNLDHEQTINHITQLSENMSSSMPYDYLDLSIDQTEPQISIVNCDTEQSHVSIGYPGVSLMNPDRYSLDLLNVILCEGMSSRLFTEVREKRGLAYDISGSTTHMRDVGSFTISAGIDKTKIISSLSLIINNLEECHKNINSIEVKNAKKLLMGRYNLGMDDPHFVSQWNLNTLLNNDNIYSSKHLDANIKSIGVEQIRETASRYLKREKLNMVVIGPHDEEMNILSNL